MRLIFWVEDDDGTIIGEKKQMPIKITEAELIVADERDAERLKKENDMIGECFATLSGNGRGAFTGEVFTALGTIVGRICHRMCADKFGVRRMFDLADAYMAQSQQKVE
jgi:hypothetical protein